MFNAVWLEQDGRQTQATLRQISESDLDAGDTLVKVEWSTLNFKDALAITGRSPIAKKFPLVPGIDLAGVVESCSTGTWKPGDQVVLTGLGYGETRFGGLSQHARVSADSLVALPAGLSTQQAMGVGTAGFTAMLCVDALERHGVTPESGDILVTGAGGGVGGFAIALLAAKGFRVVAVSGRESEAPRLKALGAAEVLGRAEFSEPGKPLAKERWAGVVDSVGSHTLANACASTRRGGVVTACGLAQGMDFPATVAPFILRAITLVGIDSVYFPVPARKELWQRIARDLPPAALTSLFTTVPLAQTLAAAVQLMAGQVSGRLVVDMR
ncbi:TPA: oxidoreductase [Pseudomonas aeruginosa]|nr:oxidoreductase [Pseudomonas aeruginosa]